jgi:hypothetical protein
VTRYVRTIPLARDERLFLSVTPRRRKKRLIIEVSAFNPALGQQPVAKRGDHFQIPTVGIVEDPIHIPLDSSALQALVRANKRALRTLADQPRLAVDYIASFLGRLTRDEAQRYYERYIGPYFTPDGHMDLNIAREGIDAVAAELGVASVAADEIYQPGQ